MPQVAVCIVILHPPCLIWAVRLPLTRTSKAPPCPDHMVPAAAAAAAAAQQGWQPESHSSKVSRPAGSPADYRFCIGWLDPVHALCLLQTSRKSLVFTCQHTNNSPPVMELISGLKRTISSTLAEPRWSITAHSAPSLMT